MSDAASRWVSPTSDAEPPPPDQATTGLLRSNLVVAAGTGLSRITGLLRTVALGYALGTLVLADAYNLANTTPNIVYDLLLGGILSATLIPVFVDNMERGDDDSTSAVVTLTTVALIVITVLAVIGAPWIVRIYTLRLSPFDAARQESVAVPLLRLFLPQILLYGLSTLGTSLLQARRKFTVPAIAPVLNNIIVIAVLLAFSRIAGTRSAGGADDGGVALLDQVRSDTGLMLLLGLGTTAGIAAMTLVLWPAIRRADIRLRWNFDHHSPAVRSVARLSGWTLGSVVANQIALFVTLALLNGDKGSVSAYSYAFIFFQLPFGLLAVSIMTTFMPELASAAGRSDFDAFRQRFSQGLRLIILVILPAAVGYVLLARPIISVLLQHGKLGPSAAALTAEALVWLAIGLPGFSVFLFALRGFYALKDTRTPFVLYVLENGINVVLAFALVGRFGLRGIIASYSIAYSFSAVVALVVLARRVDGLGTRNLMASIVRTFAAGAVLALAVWPISRWVGEPSGFGAVLRMAVGTAVGVLVYALALWILRSPDLDWVQGRLSRMSRRRG